MENLPRLGLHLVLSAIEQWNRELDPFVSLWARDCARPHEVIPLRSKIGSRNVRNCSRAGNLFLADSSSSRMHTSPPTSKGRVKDENVRVCGRQHEVQTHISDKPLVSLLLDDKCDGRPHIFKRHLGSSLPPWLDLYRHDLPGIALSDFSRSSAPLWWQKAHLPGDESK